MGRFYSLGTSTIDLEKFCNADIHVKIVKTRTSPYRAQEYSIIVNTSEGCCGKTYTHQYQLGTRFDKLIDATNAWKSKIKAH